jgi:hypothetical protein
LGGRCAGQALAQFLQFQQLALNLALALLERLGAFVVVV